MRRAPHGARLTYTSSERRHGGVDVDGNAEPPPEPAPVPRPALLARLVAFFSGTVGVVAKYVLLAIANAVGLYAFTVLLADGRWVVAAFIALATVATDIAYLVPRAQVVPLKFLLPGTVC